MPRTLAPKTHSQHVTLNPRSHPNQVACLVTPQNVRASRSCEYPMLTFFICAACRPDLRLVESTQLHLSSRILGHRLLGGCCFCFGICQHVLCGPRAVVSLAAATQQCTLVAAAGEHSTWTAEHTLTNARVMVTSCADGHHTACAGANKRKRHVCDSGIILGRHCEQCLWQRQAHGMLCRAHERNPGRPVPVRVTGRALTTHEAGTQPTLPQILC